MTIAYICVVLALVFPYVFAGLAKSDPKSFDNQQPRNYLSNLHGWRQRANWVQQNSFEIFPGFAAAVIVAHLTQASQSLINGLAIAFIVTRILFGVCYLANYANLRSVFWTLGLFAVLGLFFSSYF